MRVLVKGVLIDLSARNFVHAKTSLCTRCVHACYRTQYLSSPDMGSSIREGQNKSFSKLSNQIKGCLIIKLYGLKKRFQHAIFQVISSFL